MELLLSSAERVAEGLEIYEASPELFEEECGLKKSIRGKIREREFQKLQSFSTARKALQVAIAACPNCRETGE